MSGPMMPSLDADRAARVVLARIAEPGDPLLAAAVTQLSAPDVVQRLRAGELEHPWAARYAARLAAVDVAALLATAHPSGVRLVVPTDEAWPTQLAELDHLDGQAAPPLALWVRGDLTALGRMAVGVVGSRSATEYGVRVATDLAYDLVCRGCVVVSGAAYGIDAAAHRAALAGGGQTVAVLGCGIDQAYPAGHATLLDAISRQGAVVSEVVPGTPPSRARFLTRNRLIAGLSAGVVVVEAAVRSGALNTATWCAQLSRPVMAVPGPVTSAVSAGPHLAIARRGASLVCSADDVLELLSPAGQALGEEPREPAAARDLLPRAAAAVLDAMPARGRGSVAELAVEAGLTVQETITALGQLAAEGWVERDDTGWRRGGRPPQR
jgi:DNA processing protein